MAPPPWWWCSLCDCVVCCGLFWSLHSLYIEKYQSITLRCAYYLIIRSVGVTFWPTHTWTIPADCLKTQENDVFFLHRIQNLMTILELFRGLLLLQITRAAPWCFPLKFQSYLLPRLRPPINNPPKLKFHHHAKQPRLLGVALLVALCPSLNPLYCMHSTCFFVAWCSLFLIPCLPFC